MDIVQSVDRIVEELRKAPAYLHAAEVHRVIAFTVLPCYSPADTLAEKP